MYGRFDLTYLFRIGIVDVMQVGVVGEGARVTEPAPAFPIVPADLPSVDRQRFIFGRYLHIQTTLYFFNASFVRKSFRRLNEHITNKSDSKIKTLIN